MGARGFVFSLDAFVAFVLIMITINLLIFTIGTPKPYFAELESAHILAHDTLAVLSASGDAPSQTYLETILGNMGNKAQIDGIMRRVAGGDARYRSIIPGGYGYRLEYLDFGAANGTEQWTPIYDAGTDGCGYGSDRCGKSFTKLQASATTFLSAYDPAPMPGESPFCYASCSGYEMPDGSGNIVRAVPCNVTPCDKFNSNFLPGKNFVRVIRLVVYT